MLSDHDLATLRAYALKTETHMPSSTYSKLPYAFPNTHVPTADQGKSRAAFLSGLKPEVYDCCENSCCAFVGPHAEREKCPYCQSPRYNEQGFPVKEFSYLPLIPRLKGLHTNLTQATAMRYRGHEHQHTPGQMSDVFDAEVYQSKYGQPVTVAGRKYKHTYYLDPRDIALGLSTDGFAPFRRRKQTAWPLILYNYNLPPEIRFHKENIIPLGVVPGPKKPADFDSFLWPLIQELLCLAIGVHAWDVLTRSMFPLHAFLPLVSGAIPAIPMTLRMKGHNGYAPCRMCSITGVRVPGQARSPYYVPLERSRHPDTTIKKFDPTNLPLRSHEETMRQGREVQEAPTAVEEDRLSRQYGVKGIPILSHLHSLTFPLSFPYDFMHLVWENTIKNLVLHWTGEFKGLGDGVEEYELSADVWKAIGQATAAAGKTIPAAFGATPPNPEKDKSACTADSWSLWTLYIGPVLLARRFKKRKYYDHFISLVKLLNLCLQFEMSDDDIEEVRVGFVDWVQGYEKYVHNSSCYAIAELRQYRIYYQHDPARISACPVTIHALLHIADYIQAAGPVWASWAFPMEHFCGRLQPAIRSRRFPYANMDRHILAAARLDHIKKVYDAEELLALRRPKPDLGTELPGCEFLLLYQFIHYSLVAAVLTWRSRHNMQVHATLHYYKDSRYQGFRVGYWCIMYSIQPHSCSHSIGSPSPC